MFENTEYHLRISAWREFRDLLEESETPFSDLIQKYKRAPLVSIHTDPWDQSTWPTPWQLVEENQYCDFSCVLGMCYSLQLTNSFKDSNFEIHIASDETNSELMYLLFVDEKIIGIDDDDCIDRSDLTTQLFSQRVYSMPKLN